MKKIKRVILDVLRCVSCGAIFIDDPMFYGKCPKCGVKQGGDS